MVTFSSSFLLCNTNVFYIGKIFYFIIFVLQLSQLQNIIMVIFPKLIPIVLKSNESVLLVCHGIVGDLLCFGIFLPI